MKYRCQTPLRADEFDLRPELLRRREASKDPVSSQQGDQLLSVASDLRNLVYNSTGDKAARSASFQVVRGQIHALNERIAARGFNAATVSSHLTPLNWLADLMSARGSECLFISCDDSPASKAEAVEVMEEFVFMTFAVSKKKALEAKAASTVNRYARTLINLHWEQRSIDLSFLSPRVSSLVRGLTKVRVDLWGVRVKAKKAPVSPAMLVRLSALAFQTAGELAEVVSRAMFIAFECHFRRSTITVAAAIVKNNRWNKHWHLTRGHISYRRLDDSSVIAPVPELLRPLRDHLDWYMVVEPTPEKGDPSGERHQHSPPLCPPRPEGLPCAARAQLDCDIDDPVDPADRDSTPLLVHPSTKEPLTSEEWEAVVLELFRLYLQEQSGHDVSLEKARKVFQLHSFRIGATCSLYNSGCPLHIRQLQGRWKSMAILCYSRVMVNETISAMRNMYSASFQLFHSHHDPDLESSNAGSSLAAGELGSRQFGPGSPAAASIARGVAQKSDIRARILAGEPPPTGTADLLGALALVNPVGAADAEPVLAMAVGFDLPGQDSEVIIKLASGTRQRISWEAFKQGRRELFGKDLSDLDVPAWGPDDDLPLSNTSKKAKEAQDKSSSSESEESEYSSSSDSGHEAASADHPCQHLSRKRPQPTSLSPSRRTSAALPHQSSQQSAAPQGPQKKSVAHFKSLPQSTPLSFVKPNPKKLQSKSRSRYDAYMGSTSIAEFIMSGGSWADLVFDEAKGHCTVGNAPSEAMDISQQE